MSILFAFIILGVTAVSSYMNSKMMTFNGANFLTTFGDRLKKATLPILTGATILLNPYDGICLIMQLISFY